MYPLVNSVFHSQQATLPTANVFDATHCEDDQYPMLSINFAASDIMLGFQIGSNTKSTRTF